MKPEVLIPLIFAELFLLIDLAMFLRMLSLLKQHREDTVEDLGNRLNPYLYATAAVSVLMAVCMIAVTILR